MVDNTGVGFGRTGTSRKRSRLLVLTVVLVLVLVLGAVYALRTAILPFVLGLLFASVLLPVVGWVENRIPADCRWHEARRVGVIVGIYVVALVALAGVSFYIVVSVREPFMSFVGTAPETTAAALGKLEKWTESLHQFFPGHPEQHDVLASDLGTAMGNAVRATVTRGLSLVPQTIGMILGLFVTPVFLFYLLRDWSKLTASFRGAMPLRATDHWENIGAIVGRVVGRYVRAQLLLGLIVGALTLISLLVLGVPLAPVLAVAAGVGEVIPMVGPWIAGATAVIITLATAPDKALWVAVVFVIIQLLENLFVVPRVQGKSLDIHPAVVIVVLVVGTHLAGFWGLLLAVPLAAVVIQVYRHFTSVEPAENPGPDL